jgi:Ion channel
MMCRQLTSDRRQRYGVLLIAIVAAFFLQGIVTPQAWVQVAETVLLASTLLLALRVADARPRVMQGAVVVALAVTAASVAEAAAGDVDGTAIKIADLLLVCLAPPAIVLGIVRTLRTRNKVTVEAVLGVLCLYLLLGMFFAFLYGVIYRLSGNFFAGGVAATGARCLYFSFTTLTTVGYGDYTAASNLGHTLSVSEALLGQIYLVTIVSLIVANLGRSRSRPPELPELDERAAG